MKKLLILLAVTLLLISCTNSDQGLNSEENVTNTEVIKRNYNIIMIDGCEYIEYSYRKDNQGYTYFTHKGNCKNPIHFYKGK